MHVVLTSRMSKVVLVCFVLLLILTSLIGVSIGERAGSRNDRLPTRSAATRGPAVEPGAEGGTAEASKTGAAHAPGNTAPTRTRFAIVRARFALRPV